MAVKYEYVELAKVEAQPNYITGQDVKLTVQAAAYYDVYKAGLKMFLTKQLLNYKLHMIIRIAAVGVCQKFNRS